MLYKFDPSSKKFPCPRCEKKRFVRLIDEEGNYLDSIFGKCDRINSCAYKKFPEKNSGSYVNPYKPFVKPVKIVSYMSEEDVHLSLKAYHKNGLFQYLRSKFPEEEVLNVFRKYQVGTSKKWESSTIFWQIEVNGNIRGGKVMKFDANTGKRVKHPFTHITWVHRLLKLKDYQLEQILFGEHRLKDCINDQPACIVESEKTALVMALILPNYIWLATSSEPQFKLQTIKRLQSHKIIVFPDTDAFDKWSKKAVEFSKQLKIDIRVSSLLMDNTIAMDQSKGFDLADLIDSDSS